MLLSTILFMGLWLSCPTEAGIIPDVDAAAAYDYIIFGSGAGGGPLVARLATYGYRVLLMDAGDDQTGTYQYRLPALSLKASEYPPIAWNFYVNHFPTIERQIQDSKMTWAAPSGRLFVGSYPPPGSKPMGILYPRAGTLGGCTAHNALITAYPDESDWDNIARLTGDDSWAAPKMRAFFLRLERKRYLPALFLGHGLKGWLTTSVTSLLFVLRDVKLIALVLGAASATGQGIDKIRLDAKGLAQVVLKGLNSALPSRDRREGLFQMPLAINYGERSGPIDFIRQVLNAKDGNGQPKYKLDILLNAFVTRVQFLPPAPGVPPRAIGVRLIRGQSVYRADPRAPPNLPLPPDRLIRARREVIVAAGAFNTPQLLKLSGIGPAAELRHWGIKVIVYLPGVGTNLQDRYESTVTTSSPSKFGLVQDCTWLNSFPDPCLERWRRSDTVTGKGAYTTSGIALAVLKNSSVAANDIPDLFIAGGLANFRGYFPGYSELATADPRYWTWIVLKAHTRNRAGTVRLKSNDPRDPPIINFNYFDTGTNGNMQAELDARALAEGVMWARNATANINHFPLPSLYSEDWPENRVRTRRELQEHVKREAWGHHASCTCPIGADNDPMAVLDSRFRVRGVNNLRVVDASVFPVIPGYFIALPIFMIAEKAAAVIDQDNRSAQQGRGPGQGFGGLLRSFKG